MAKYEMDPELQDEISYRLGYVTEKIKEDMHLSDEEALKTAKAFLLDVIYKRYNMDNFDLDSAMQIMLDWECIWG